jgi:uncharacterized membrane protein HdeD (DUF308 family)
MTGDDIDFERLSFTLLLRGAFVIPLAAVAIRWPEPALVLAMVAAGGVIGTFGIFELAAGLVSGTLPSTRWFFFGHGVVSIAFGVVTASIPVASSTTALALSTGWLALNALFTLLLGIRRWEHWRERLAVLAWSAVNVVCALAMFAWPPPTTFALLYALALYTFMLGMAQLAAAAWIHRASTKHLFKSEFR